MASKWIRSQDDAPSPSTRTVVIRYNPSATENSELERLLAQIPYGLTNKTWLECLRAGTKAMLRKLDQESEKTPSPEQTKAEALARHKAPSPYTSTATLSSAAQREASAPLPSDGKSIQTIDEPAAPPAPTAGFSKAAQRMFDS